jgi:flagellar export protein FliJ
MPFRYQMQKVLDLMMNREKAIDAEVQAATAIRDAEKAKLDEIDMRKLAAQKGLSAQMAAGATSDVAASNDYIQVLNQRAEAQARVLRGHQATLEAVKVRQVIAKQERNKIEKHREVKEDIWKAEEKKKEAKRMDEMAGTIFMKKRLQNEEANREELERSEKMAALKVLRELRDKRDRNRY